MSFRATDLLFEKQDREYGDFQAKLTPTIDRKSFIGVRVPDVRAIAKVYKNDAEATEFMKALPHEYYDEYMLHGLLVSEITDYDRCIEELERFLPYVDNWAVCDTMSPTVFKRHKAELIENIKVWIASDHIYTCRFGMGMLMKYFLDEDFKPQYLELPASVVSDEYYVNMMIAWFFATALAKQWDASIPYLTKRHLPVWVHNKTIQKARESYRITPQQKEYLNTLKVR